jgi:DNA-nicking Smr family endonuclease
MAPRRKNKGRPKAAKLGPKPSEFEHRPLARLKGLKRQPADQEPPTVHPPRADPSALQAEQVDSSDQIIFEQAMTGVRPIAGRSAELPPEPSLPPRPSATERERDEVMQALEELVSGERPFSIFETDEAIEGLSEGVDQRLLRRLKRGDFSVQDHLDLHGTTREEAKPLVAQFLTQALASQKRCVLIIHGRGHGSKDHIPVLKLALRSWLERSGIRKNVLAFSTARPCDGGAGAVYVLLRRLRGG